MTETLDKAALLKELEYLISVCENSAKVTNGWNSENKLSKAEAYQKIKTKIEGGKFDV